MERGKHPFFTSLPEFSKEYKHLRREIRYDAHFERDTCYEYFVRCLVSFCARAWFLGLQCILRCVERVMRTILVPLVRRPNVLLTELLLQIQHLTRTEKLRLIQLLAEDLVEEGSTDELRFTEECRMPLSDRDRDRFLEMLENPREPTEALKKALAKHRARKCG